MDGPTQNNGTQDDSHLMMSGYEGKTLAPQSKFYFSLFSFHFEYLTIDFLHIVRALTTRGPRAF